MKDLSRAQALGRLFAAVSGTSLVFPNAIPEGDKTEKSICQFKVANWLGQPTKTLYFII
jgi:hypothetical protein